MTGGWLEAAAIVVAIGALSLVCAFNHTLGARPIAFILFAMLDYATATFAVVGVRPNARRIVLHPPNSYIRIPITLTEVVSGRLLLGGNVAQ